jgi:NAD(P)-dependent dehydrogenase (short-subunit alcohol dehydrogenase family)
MPLVLRNSARNWPDRVALIAGIVPMGRLGTPEEIGELVDFPASGRSQFVTGQVIHFTGGWL